MQLVITYHVSDGATYDFRATEPVEYPSPEQFICDFDEWYRANENQTFRERGFAGMRLSNDIPPDQINVYTLQEWFDKHAVKPTPRPSHG